MLSLVIVLLSNSYYTMTSTASTSSSSSSSLYAIDKLTGDNFSSWKFRLQLVLMDRGLWEIVDGTEVAPTVLLGGNSGDGALSITDGGSSGSGKVKVDPISNTEYLNWKKRDNQALAQIALTICNTELVHIRNAKSSHEAWKKICTVYEAKGLTAKIFLRRKFFNIKYIDSNVGSMQQHINVISDLAHQLDSISAGVSDEDMAMTLLCSLPESYDYLIVALESRNSNDLTFDFVSSRLLNEEKRKEEQSNVNANIVGYGKNVSIANNMNGINNQVNNVNNDNTGNSNIALYSKSFNGNNGNNVSKFNKANIKCTYCNKKNHTEATCYKKHGYPNNHPKYSNNLHTSNNANIASVSVNNATLNAFMVGDIVHVTNNNVGNHSNTNSIISDWLIDSGASVHLCNNRSYFNNATFHSIPYKNVVLGNNECIAAIGMGDVPVRVTIIDTDNVNNVSNNVNNVGSYIKQGNNTNTTKHIDVVFKDVLYVPDIAANLLSVAKMTGNGVQVMFNGNQCTIYNKLGDCIGTAYKQSHSNLYRISVHPMHAMVGSNVHIVGNLNNNNNLQH